VCAFLTQSRQDRQVFCFFAHFAALREILEQNPAKKPYPEFTCIKQHKPRTFLEYGAF
jgi:hypothetical protein